MSKKILFIIGSLRKESFHKEIAEYVKESIGNRAEVEFLDYKNVPLFNQDIEWPEVNVITKVRTKALEADGIWVFSPEYNGKIPGVLKNLFDWLSRSLDPTDGRGASAVHEKKVTITSGAGAPKATLVRKELAELLPFMRMKLIGGEGTGITFGVDTWTTGKIHLTEEEKTEINNQIDEFLKVL